LLSVVIAAEIGDKSAGVASVSSEATSVTKVTCSGGTSSESGDLIAISGAMTPEIAIKSSRARERRPLAPLQQRGLTPAPGQRNYREDIFYDVKYLPYTFEKSSRLCRLRESGSICSAFHRYNNRNAKHFG
jgi:hypothetical protein